MTVRTYSQQNVVAPAINKALIAIADEEKLDSIDRGTISKAVQMLWDMETHIRWEAQTVHQTHHVEQGGYWWNCPKSTCQSTQKVLGIES